MARGGDLLSSYEILQPLSEQSDGKHYTHKPVHRDLVRSAW